MSEAFHTLAAAKLNLTLDVLGKRNDGFHNLSSIAISIDLADQVTLTSGVDGFAVAYRDAFGRRVSIETLDDIIVRAHNVLSEHAEIPSGSSVSVIKRIPLTSGLGGGSTDAAAFLRLAREAWQLPLSEERLAAIGAEVGSDVVACLIGGMVRMSGRGEHVTTLTPPAKSFTDTVLLLHRPEIPVPATKTAAMYRSLRPSDYRDGTSTERLQGVLLSGRQPTQFDCVNSFDRTAREVMQGLHDAWRAMGAAIGVEAVKLGEEPVTPLLAGAGPTLFAIISGELAQRAAERLSARRGFTFVAKPLSREMATRIWKT